MSGPRSFHKGAYVRCRLHLLLPTVLVAGSLSLHAQAPVVGASDPDALFHSSDPKLNANEQAAYHIVKDLLEAGHWELADKYLTERYIQHNPNAASGRVGVVKFFRRAIPRRGSICGVSRMAKRTNIGIRRRGCNDCRLKCARHCAVL